jgi:hypothetical protein
VAEFLSKEWLDQMAALAPSRPPVPGANGTISVTITSGRGDEVAYHWSYQDGVPGAGGVGVGPDADLVVTMTRADAELIASGEVEPSVAFMRGRLKAAGDGGLLVGWLASTGRDPKVYDAWLAREAALGDN